MKNNKIFFLLVYLFYLNFKSLFGYLNLCERNTVFGLYKHDMLNSSKDQETKFKDSEVYLDKIRDVDSCFIPELQTNEWYAPMVYFRRYKHINLIYKKCSVAKLKKICKQFSNILNCRVNLRNNEIMISPGGKEASTIFSILHQPTNDLSNSSFELFSGCVYELGKMSSLRVRCRHSNKVNKFPLKLIIKVDGRTSDFLYHFNHELIMYSRIASSTYGDSKVRLHPSIYSIFIGPNRKIISKDLLIMEFIDGPSLSSIVSKLNNFQQYYQYISNELANELEKIMRSNYSEFLLNNTTMINSKVQFLEDKMNNWFDKYIDKIVIFSINFYRRLLYLLDLFHRGGKSFYPEEKDDFSRGRWKYKKSFRMHCDFHEGNILIKLPEKYKSNQNIYNLTYDDILNIDLYEDLKIIDLENTIEFSESDFPIPVDKFIATHPCPIYLTDAEISSHLLNNAVSISKRFNNVLMTINDFLRTNKTEMVFGNNTMLSNWFKEYNQLASSGYNHRSLKVKDSVFNKIKVHLLNWEKYIELMYNDEILKPCISYYRIKYDSKIIPRSPLPCSWLSNILFSKKSCKYLEIAHGTEFNMTYNLSNENSTQYKDLSNYLINIYNNSSMVNCHINEKEALNITANNISNIITEYLPSTSEINETNWGEWSLLFKNLKVEQTINNSSKLFYKDELTTNSLQSLNFDSNYKMILNYNSIFNSSYSISDSNLTENAHLNASEISSNNNLKENNLPNFLNLINTEKVKKESDSNENLSKSLTNGNISTEFEKLVIELMGLAALQRIIGFCTKLKSEIDCQNINYSKITRDGPIASYIVKQINNSKSNNSKNKNDFSQFLDPCILSFNKDSVSFENIGWMCFKPMEPIINNTFKIIVDGRLFLNVNETFVDESKNEFVFNDVLDYFGIQNKQRFDKDFNDEAISIINKHRKDAINFWHLESKIRNLNSIINNKNSKIFENQNENSLSRMFIFHSNPNIKKVQVKLFMDSYQSNDNFYYLPISNKKSDLSKQIKSIIQVGLLSENVFFTEDQSIDRVSNLISKVSNFHNEVHLYVWITYSTLFLTIFDNLIKTHAYMISISYEVLNFLNNFRSIKEFDISFNNYNNLNDSYLNKTINITYKDNKIPIICDFSLKRISIQKFSNMEFKTVLSNLKKLTLFGDNKINFIGKNDKILEACPNEYNQNTDLQVLINELIIPSLDPIYSLNKAKNSLSKVKNHLSVENRRSIWFIMHVCKYVINYIENFNVEKRKSENIPTLLRSIFIIIDKKKKIIESILLVSKCIIYNPINNEFKLEKCTMNDYINISNIILNELLSMFDEQRNLFANKTSLGLAKEFISYVRDNLKIPTPEEIPPSGGLGFLFEKKNKFFFADKNRSSNSRNENISYTIKWPIMADIWQYFKQT